ncbi:MAG: KTSC domain-containing protein [Bordetella sp.]|nr:KTSC domain-containing protein [Bordetella sp.]
MAQPFFGRGRPTVIRRPNWAALSTHFAVVALALCGPLARAETVQVKYHGPVVLDAFSCTDVNEGSDVTRICYDGPQRYMVIRLRSTYYHYCEVDAATMQALQKAGSKRQFFETRIRGSGSDGPFDCRSHPVPKKYRQ